MDAGNTAWMLISTGLVLFMTPGLAFFYGGMVRAKNVLGMLMQNFFAMGLLAIIWVAIAFSLAFGNFGDGGWIGNLDFAWMKGVNQTVGPDAFALTIPFILFCAYQMTFAVITPALITGATADRLKFKAYAVFIAIWLVVVYAPVAHWVFGGGWLAKLGALDFAGGAVVHINAGAAALAMVIVLGKRRGWPREGMHPHSLPLISSSTNERCADSMPAIARNPASPATHAPRLLSLFNSGSTTGAGRECRFTCAPANAWRISAPRWPFAFVARLCSFSARLRTAAPFPIG